MGRAEILTAAHAILHHPLRSGVISRHERRLEGAQETVQTHLAKIREYTP